jgi:hypothetical protein
MISEEYTKDIKEVIAKTISIKEHLKDKFSAPP